MRVATFNANSIRARLPIVVEWLTRHSPDVLCLQETKAQDPDFPRDAFSDLGYHVVFRGEKSYNGVAIAARARPARVSFGLDDGDEPDDTRLVRARFGRLDLVNTYVPQGMEITSPRYEYKLRWFARLRRFFERHYKPTGLLLWVGDLNVAPGPLDVWEPARYADHVCYHEDARRAFADVVSWGFVDVFRRHRPEPGHFTFWDYRMPRALEHNHGWRLDHVLATPRLADLATAAHIDTAPRALERPSDHTFVVAEFDL